MDASVLTVGALAAVTASIGVIGADLPWLVPVGASVASGHIPDSLTSAAAPTAGWHDALAGGQLAVWGVYHHLGARGLVLLQALAAALGFGALAYGLQRRSSGGAALAVCTIVLVGAASSVLVVRVSLFSLALFPLLLLLLHEDARAPDSRIWLSVPLLGVWANLHGMVLAGVALLAVYLVFERGRREPAVAAAVLGSSLVAVCLTPQLWRTPLYYRGILENEAAARGAGLWAPLGLRPFDVLAVLAAVALLACARGRLRPWEWAAALGLGAATVHTARMGLFLLFVAAYPAARAMRVRTPGPALLGGAACGLAVLAGAALLLSRPASSTGLARKAAVMGGVVLADPLQAEWVELYGGRIWVGNPIDAFRRSDQRLYLDWAAGEASGRAAVDHAGLVLVDATSPAGRAAAHDRRLRRLQAGGGVVLYEVRSRV